MFTMFGPCVLNRYDARGHLFYNILQYFWIFNHYLL